MNLERMVLTIALTAVATIAIAQGVPATASYAADGQKAEPNAQAPAVPQANNPASLNPPDPATNAALQGRIQQALQNDSTLSSSHVSVSVTDSAIELSGTAASIKDKETAERIAQSFDGNRKFTDKLTVTGQAPGANNSGAGSSNPQH